MVTFKPGDAASDGGGGAEAVPKMESKNPAEAGAAEKGAISAKADRTQRLGYRMTISR
jgi:hypothetical protein